MKFIKNWLWLVAVGFIVLILGGMAFIREYRTRSRTIHSSNLSASHSPMDSASRVPAFLSAAETGNLKPTLSPEQFLGKSREAYKVAKDIPETLAQLPCYCHCDRTFGHKSLHSCFEDDHASHCAICADEALMAYELQKNQHLTVEEIRKTIIEKYSS